MGISLATDQSNMGMSNSVSGFADIIISISPHQAFGCRRLPGVSASAFSGLALWRITITWQVDQAALFVQLEEVEQLGTPWGLRRCVPGWRGSGCSVRWIYRRWNARQGHFMAEIFGHWSALAALIRKGSLLAQADNWVLGLHLVSVMA